MSRLWNMGLHLHMCTTLDQQSQTMSHRLPTHNRARTTASGHARPSGQARKLRDRTSRSQRITIAGLKKARYKTFKPWTRVPIWAIARVSMEATACPCPCRTPTSAPKEHHPMHRHNVKRSPSIARALMVGPGYNRGAPPSANRRCCTRREPSPAPRRIPGRMRDQYPDRAD